MTGYGFDPDHFFDVEGRRGRGEERIEMFLNVKVGERRLVFNSIGDFYIT